MRVPYGNVVGAMVLMQQGGVENVGFITDPLDSYPVPGVIPTCVLNSSGCSRLIRDTYNIIPFIFAGVFHALVLGGLIVAFDFSRAARPPVPLAISATLVTTSEVPEPPPVVREPEPDPEPEPDRSNEERARLEEEKTISRSGGRAGSYPQATGGRPIQALTRRGGTQATSGGGG